jgi:hypothetical protein
MGRRCAGLGGDRLKFADDAQRKWVNAVPVLGLIPKYRRYYRPIIYLLRFWCDALIAAGAIGEAWRRTTEEVEPLNTKESFCNSMHADQMHFAERELSGFIDIEPSAKADRGALASQSVFLLGDEKAAYQAGQPADDARFIPAFAHSLEHTGGYTPEEARRAAAILLPDILPYDPDKPASYPSNGRTLTDDAIDVFLPILTNGKVTRDNVGPHTDLLDSYPYVGAPHKNRSKERVAA